MPGELHWLGVLAALALMCAAGPALADFSACDGALRASDPQQQIDLYSLCLKKGGLVATDVAGAFNNRGIAYERLGQVDNAFQDYNAAIQYDPTWGTPHLNRARIYLGRREWALADADLSQALREEPPEPRAMEFHLRAQARLRLGRYREAAADFDDALKRDRKLIAAYNGEAWLLATCPDPAVRNGAKAVQLAQAGLKLQDEPMLHDTLAAAYAEAGQYDDAVREQGRAIELAKARAPGRDLSDWSARLDLYRARTAFHEPQPTTTAAN